MVGGGCFMLRMGYSPRKPLEIPASLFGEEILCTSFSWRVLIKMRGWRRMPGVLHRVDLSQAIILEEMAKLWCHTNHRRRTERTAVHRHVWGRMCLIPMSGLILRHVNWANSPRSPTHYVTIGLSCYLVISILWSKAWRRIPYINPLFRFGQPDSMKPSV